MIVCNNTYVNVSKPERKTQHRKFSTKKVHSMKIVHVKRKKGSDDCLVAKTLNLTSSDDHEIRNMLPDIVSSIPARFDILSESCNTEYWAADRISLIRYFNVAWG